MYENAARNLETNPFVDLKAENPLKLQYERKLNELARRFIYDRQDLNPAVINQVINEARRDSKLATIENDEHELEKLSYLLKALEAHERADIIHRGAWQAALIRQKSQLPLPPKPPEALTRQEVAKEFEVFQFAKAMKRAEQQALEYYEKLLDLEKDYELILIEDVSIDKKISIDAADVAVLVNDLKTRMTERIEDDTERKSALQNLDDGLRQIIDSVPEGQRGKRSELMEAYLLRNLIHAADTGHLVNISHGTPREDLRQGEGSVDLALTFAGSTYYFQVKTYKRNVLRERKLSQEWEIEKARRHLQGTQTRLAVLDAGDVRNSYEAAVESENTSLSGKYRTFRPILQELNQDERDRLLHLLGMNESDLKREEAVLQNAWEGLESEREARKADETERAQRAAFEIKPYLQAEQQARELAEDQRVAALRNQEEARERDLETARKKRETTLEAEQQKLARIKTKLDAAAGREAEKKIADAKPVVASKPQPLKIKEEKSEDPWKGTTLLDLKIKEILFDLGITPQDPETYIDTKNSFIRLFSNQKKRTPSEKDPVNKKFKEIFPTKESYETPSKEKLEQLRELL